jgi:hypothetical protein
MTTENTKTNILQPVCAILGYQLCGLGRDGLWILVLVSQTNVDRGEMSTLTEKEYVGGEPSFVRMVL